MDLSWLVGRNTPKNINLNMGLAEAKKLSETLASLKQNILTKTQETANFTANIREFLDSAKEVTIQGNNCLQLSTLVCVDAEDVTTILKHANGWNRKYGTGIPPELKDKAIEEYNQMRLDFNSHYERHKTMRAKVKTITGVAGDRVLMGTGGKTLNEVLAEEQDLADDLTLLATQIKFLTGKADKMKTASKKLQSRANELNQIAVSTQSIIGDISRTTESLIKSATNFGSLNQHLDNMAHSTRNTNNTHLTHDINTDASSSSHGTLTEKPSAPTPVDLSR